MKNKVEQKIEKTVEGDGFEKTEQLFRVMQEKLNADEFEILKKLRNEEVKSYNNFEQNLYGGTGCLDYVWVEKSGKKDFKF